LWLESAGTRCSTVDLFGREVVLLAGPAGAAWCAAAKRAAIRFAGLPLKTYCVGASPWSDPEDRFCGAYGVEPDGACLVRLDGYVAWRARVDAPNREAAVGQALAALLARI
jgi:hypothetical protein